MNYFAVNKQSSVILSVVHSAVTPTNTGSITFYPAPKDLVNQYLVRLGHEAPISIYTILPQPVVPDALPLTLELEEELRAYVDKNHRWESVERMAYKWRVTEQTIIDILGDPDRDKSLA